MADEIIKTATNIPYVQGSTEKLIRDKKTYVIIQQKQ